MKSDSLRVIYNRIEQLKMIKDNIIGDGEEKEGFTDVLKELRILYLKNPQLFNDQIVKNINDMKNSIDNYKGNKYPNNLNEQSKITNINKESLKEKEMHERILRECNACKHSNECLKRNHVNGICHDYAKGFAAIDYTQWDAHY